MALEGWKPPIAEGVDEDGEVKIPSAEETPQVAPEETETPAEEVTPEEAVPPVLETPAEEVAAPESSVPPILEDEEVAPEITKTAEVTVETPVEQVVAETVAESSQETSPLDVGRERLSRFGNFLGGIKDRLVEKIKSGSGKIGTAIGATVKLAGKAGLAVLSADELVKRGVTKSVEYTQEKYNEAKEKVVAAKDYVVESVENGLDYVNDKVEDTIDFGRLSLARATERITNPLANFQAEMFGTRLRHLANRLEKGKKISVEELDAFQEKINLLRKIATL